VPAGTDSWLRPCLQRAARPGCRLSTIPRLSGRRGAVARCSAKEDGPALIAIEPLWRRRSSLGAREPNNPLIKSRGPVARRAAGRGLPFRRLWAGPAIVCQSVAGFPSAGRESGPLLAVHRGRWRMRVPGRFGTQEAKQVPRDVLQAAPPALRVFPSARSGRRKLVVEARCTTSLLRVHRGDSVVLQIGGRPGDEAQRCLLQSCRWCWWRAKRYSPKIAVAVEGRFRFDRSPSSMSPAPRHRRFPLQTASDWKKIVAPHATFHTGTRLPGSRPGPGVGSDRWW